MTLTVMFVKRYKSEEGRWAPDSTDGGRPGVSDGAAAGLLTIRDSQMNNNADKL